MSRGFWRLIGAKCGDLFKLDFSRLRPEDYEFGKERPWTAEELKKSTRRANEYQHWRLGLAKRNAWLKKDLL